jgi:MFS family permease
MKDDVGKKGTKKETKKWARRAVAAETQVEERDRLLEEKDAVIRAKDDIIAAQAGEIVSLRKQTSTIGGTPSAPTVNGDEPPQPPGALPPPPGAAPLDTDFIEAPLPPDATPPDTGFAGASAPPPPPPPSPPSPPPPPIEPPLPFDAAPADAGAPGPPLPPPPPTNWVPRPVATAATVGAAAATGAGVGTQPFDTTEATLEQPVANGPATAQEELASYVYDTPDTQFGDPVALRSNQQPGAVGAEATGGVGMPPDASAVVTPSAVASSGSGHGPLYRFFFVHQIDEYPSSRKRTGYLALAVLATIMLYYTYYTQTGVTPNILVYYHMSFKFYVWIVIISNLIGAFASLPASKTDKLGRANVIIYGLLIVGVLVAFGVPNVSGEWGFATVISAIGLVEGALLVATPAMVRDFSPQVGRASAMGFWTVGPVAGSLITSIVANHTLNHFLAHSPYSGWKSQFYISGIASIVTFVLCLFFMMDLSSKLRDQLMVSAQDRALVEARARGISTEEVIAATHHPWRQILKWDLVGSSFGIAVFLLVYYAAAGFFTIFYSTVFVNPSGLNFTVAQANGLNTWFWGADAIALIVFGLLSDLLKVRKPFMLVGSVGAIFTLIYFLMQTTHPHTSYYKLAAIEVVMAAFLSLAYAPWMAGYTEMVEKKNPALVGTGLALWGWILRLTVGVSFIFLPLVITSVNPVVDNLPLATNTIPGTNTNVQDFLVQHPKSVSFALAHSALLKLVQAHESVVLAASNNPSSANVDAVIAAIGEKNAIELNSLKAPFTSLVKPYPNELAFLSAHQAQLTQLQNGVKQSPNQWKTWFWVCVAGMLAFIPTIWLNRGRWSPARARDDEDEHEADVARELRELVGAPA